MSEKNKIKVIFEDGFIKLLYTSLPTIFFSKNRYKWLLHNNELIYESKDYNLNFENIKTNLKKIEEKINNDFNEYNLNFSFDENFHKNVYVSDTPNINALCSFIKSNKDINIIINIGDYKELIKILGNEKLPNLNIIIPNSDEQIPYNEFYNMYTTLDEIIEFVNHYNLSPLEKVLFIYDIVKSNEYKKENKNENYRESRNLNRIVSNNKIVCLGFANLIDYLLSELGFKSSVVTLGYTNREKKHARNLLYLKDDKYNIDGMFFLDATWDSKKSENYLDNYNFFMKPLKFFEKYNNNEYIIGNNEFNILKLTDDDLREYINSEEEIYFSGIINELFLLSLEKSKDKLFAMSSITKDDLFNMTKNIQQKYNKKIPKEAFKNALYRIRKIEYINNIFKCDLSEEYIDNICSKYFVESPEEKLLKAIGLYDEPTLEKDLESSNAYSTKQDILRMQFLKKLKEKLNDFPDNKYIKKM